LTNAGAEYELVLGDQTHVPLVRELTIGRAPGNAVQLSDPAVSRLHARISPANGHGGPVIEDAGSSYGTWVDGRRVDGPFVLRDGARITLGDQELVVERRRDDAEAGRTVLVPPGASLVIPSSGESQLLGAYPRLRSGYALKRLAASEGERRWVLKDLVGGRLVRLADGDADLLQFVDGRHSLDDLTHEAEERFGSRGPARLARLLGDLGARGLLAGTDRPAAGGAATEGAPRLLRARKKAWLHAGEFFDRVYARGGWLLFTRPALAAIAITAVVGLATFVYLVAARYGTPFVVARKIGLGGLVFLVGRLAIAALHEAAHGLTMASFGRRVGEAGVKLVLIFPYTYVDTSDAWFESRLRRIAVSAAGPVSDLLLGGSFALACLFTPAGTVRDIFFQLAFGAYVGALFNLNPLLERDGYQILVDVLGEPGLRARSREALRARLSGRGAGSRAESPAVMRYAVLGAAWSGAGALVAIAMSLRYERELVTLVPATVVWPVMWALWLALLTPVLAMLVVPVVDRVRARAG
jgi:putative peptide zinc metalloprotease protein